MIKFFNTLTRKKEEFITLKDGEVAMYACGPTVYDNAQIGNLRAYIFVDVLRRVLEMNGYKVNEVMNITDVGHLTSDEDSGEDKMEKGAKREKLTVWQVAEKYTKAFLEDIKKLNIELPTVLAKATDNIAEQIDYIKELEKKGFTYKIGDGVYFDTSKLSDYGVLAKLDIEGLKAGARVEVNPQKKNPTDFALWKFSPEGGRRQMEWESPWGKGFPGWHIECSAMSYKYLGDQFDIHTGGVDHIPVHHTNEIAQAEAFSGKIPARYWLHNEFLLVDGEKMAKSAGNYYTLDDLTEKGFEPLAFRYLVLGANYRTRVNFTWHGLEGAQATLRKIRGLKNDKTVLEEKKRAEVANQVKEALADDLDTTLALALLHQANDFRLWKDFDTVLALDVEKEEIVPAEVLKLVNEREEARKNKNWEKSDKIREEIEGLGYEVEDTASGAKVKKK